MSHHSDAFLEVMAPVVNGAAVNTDQYEFILFRIAEIKVNFDTAERCRNLIDDPRNEFFKVESGGDPLRKLLQAYQFRYPESGCFRCRRAGEAKIRE
jgi:hypothetical protein